jgi:hypothetical protein
MSNSYYGFDDDSDDITVIEEVPSPIIMDYDEIVDVSDLLDHVVALSCKKKEELVASIRLIHHIHEYECQKTFNKSVKTGDLINALWKRVRVLHQYNDNELRARIKSIRSVKAASKFPGFRAHLHMSGVRSVIYRVGDKHLMNLSDGVSAVIDTMIANPELLKTDFDDLRIRFLDVMVKRITTLAGPRDWDTVSEDLKKGHLRFLQKFSSWFLFGAECEEMTEFKPDSFKGLGESGMSSPMLSPPKVFLEGVAREFAYEQYGAMAVFIAEENATVFPPTIVSGEGASLVTTEDESSVACIDWTPALSCGLDDVNGWEWRRVEKEVALDAGHSINIKNKDNRQVQVELNAAVEEGLLYRARAMAEGMTPLRAKGQYGGPLSPDYAKKFGVKYYICFYSRKLSQMDDVKNNLGVIHFVAPSIAKQLVRKFKAFVVDAVSHVVMLIPRLLFKRSISYKNKEPVTHFVPFPVEAPYKGFQLAMSVISSHYHIGKIRGETHLNANYYNETMADRLQDLNDHLVIGMFKGTPKDYIFPHLQRLIGLFFRHEDRRMVPAGSSKEGRQAVAQFLAQSKYSSSFTEEGYYNLDDDDEFGLFDLDDDDGDSFYSFADDDAFDDTGHNHQPNVEGNNINISHQATDVIGGGPPHAPLSSEKRDSGEGGLDFDYTNEDL